MNFSISQKNRGIKRERGGFLIIEMIVAAAIIASAFLIASGVAQKSIYTSRLALRIAQASFLLEEGAEAVRILRDNNWANLTSLSTSSDYYLSFTGGTWTLTETPSTVGQFTRIVTIKDVERDAGSDITTEGSADPGTKLVTVTVAWPEGTETITKSLSFYITDLFGA